MPIDYVLNDMSYANMIMYGAILPSYDSDKKDKAKEGAKHETLNADDPANIDKINLFGED